MSTHTSGSQDDLAFLRNLLQGDSGAEIRRKFGLMYLLCGALWTPYILLQWVRTANLAPVSEKSTQIAWLVIMVLFVGAMIWGNWPRRSGPRTTSNRAFAAAFAGIGYSYLVVLAVLLYLTYERRNGIFILIYAVVVFAGQGAGWYVAWALQRQVWIGIVALGWFMAALVTGLNLLNLANFLLLAAVSMILFMAIPGCIMILKSKPEGSQSHERSFPA